jgi:hypothetical protein
VFKKHQITEERLHRCLEGAFHVRAPEIVSVADRFLNTIVEVVSVCRRVVAGLAGLFLFSNSAGWPS